MIILDVMYKPVELNLIIPNLENINFTDIPDYLNEISLHRNIIEYFHKKAAKEYDDHVKNYIKKNLKQLGFDFFNDDYFIDFIKKRVTKVSFEDRPNEYEIYLDFNKKTQKLIGILNNSVSIYHEGSNYTAIFGLRIG